MACSNRPKFKLIRPQCDTESLLSGTRAVQGGLYILCQLSTPLTGTGTGSFFSRKTQLRYSFSKETGILPARCL